MRRRHGQRWEAAGHLRARGLCAAPHARAGASWRVRAGCECGSVTLEAGISVTIFIMLACFLVTLFPMFMIQHATAHAMLETGESLSLDAFAAEHYDKAAFEAARRAVTSISDYKYTHWSEPDETYVTLGRDWYHDEDADETGAVNEEFVLRTVEQVRKRFLVYLVGDATDPSVAESDIEEVADIYLRQMKVADGVDGLDFSDSYIFHMPGTDEYELTIVLRYYFTDQFRLLSEPLNVHQSLRVRLWTRKTDTDT